MPVLTATSRREIEVHRFPVLVYALVPLAALVLQAWLPRVLGRYAWFDLPLVVVVYFAMGRPSPIQGTIMGCILGIFEDALTQHAIGINGVAKTIVGFLSSSFGIRLDVENHTVRVLLTLALSLVSSGLYFFVYRILLGLSMEWDWINTLFIALGNTVVALILFPFLDRFRIRD
ncbi:MAG: rod shape-determining protein MreD [Acidobacteriota bacterium]|nr:rod shape-determining protein MreD [Acidobacteriota bacterium]MDE3163248.1 rod shape-determining protein MreD [Acidobacteriota bacterium]